MGKLQWVDQLMPDNVGLCIHEAHRRTTTLRNVMVHPAPVTHEHRATTYMTSALVTPMVPQTHTIGAATVFAEPVAIPATGATELVLVKGSVFKLRLSQV